MSKKQKSQKAPFVPQVELLRTTEAAFEELRYLTDAEVDALVAADLAKEEQD